MLKGTMAIAVKRCFHQCFRPLLVDRRGVACATFERMEKYDMLYFLY